jgi:pimeloyl-ACP methyl ester carboxylesterase
MARLGYHRYGAQGSDWGTSVSSLLGQRHREHVLGIHLMPPLAPPDPDTLDDLTEPERVALADLARAAEWESGYSREHATRPQTIGYSLADSPAGLCAWIIEKFQAWTDCDGHPENALTRDELLDNLMLYWLPRTGALRSSLLGEHRAGERVDRRRGSTRADRRPDGVLDLPREIQRPSRRWAERRFPDIRHGMSWTEAATSQPSSNPSCSSTRYEPSSDSSASPASPSAPPSRPHCPRGSACPG